jgi:hypothetical protein
MYCLKLATLLSAGVTLGFVLVALGFILFPVLLCLLLIRFVLSGSLSFVLSLVYRLKKMFTYERL